MKTPGYELCSKWVSEIWDEFSADLVRKSFEMCGVHNHHQGLQGLKLDNLHSTLKSLLSNEEIINNSIEMDIELAEANNNMSNDVAQDLFTEGSGAEEDEELAVEDELMELQDLDEGEMRLLQELENSLLGSGPSSQYEIHNDLQNELRSVLTSSPRDEIEIEENGSTYVNLQCLIPSAQVVASTSSASISSASISSA